MAYMAGSRVKYHLATIITVLKQFMPARRYLDRAAAICRDTDEQYEECEKIRRMRKSLPGGFGKGGVKKQRRKEKRKKKRHK